MPAIPKNPPKMPSGTGKSTLSPKTSKYLELRSRAFAEATSRKAGKPKDGVTYGTMSKKKT